MANEPFMKIKTPDGAEQEITVEQLCASNHITYQALVSLLVKKGIFSPEELMEEVKRVQVQNFGTNE